MTDKLYITHMGRKVCIGFFEADTFHKVVNINRHLYRNTNSWGISHDILKNQILGRVRYINVTEQVYRKEYWTTPQAWLHQGHMLNFGGDLQVFLPLDKFAPSKKMTEPEQPELF